jgi:tRNA A37 threonylcarbamoyladenosine dehydratase
MYERIIGLIGIDNFNKIKNTKILLVGVGGVGGFAYEALIRSGFQNITIIDKDKVELSNLNRQLIANLNTINKSKVDIAKSNALNINENIKIKAIEAYLNKDNINILENDYNYIIDACDTLNTKLELIRYAQTNNIKIISSMGVGNRVDASKIEISTLDKTYNDPLAKKLRKLVKDNHLNTKVKVVYSKELPNKKGKVDSMITSPGIAGLLIVNYIINDIINPY